MPLDATHHLLVAKCDLVPSRGVHIVYSSISVRDIQILLQCLKSAFFAASTGRALADADRTVAETLR